MSSLRDALEQVPESIDNRTMPFGKHKGTLMRDLPIDYVEWLSQQRSEPGRERFSLRPQLTQWAKDKVLAHKTSNQRGKLTADEQSEQLAIIVALQSEVSHFYARLFHLGTGGHFHAFVEWCGVMSEHLNIARGLIEQGIPAFEMNRHTGQALPIPGYQITYLAEKMQCIFDGIIEVRPAVSIERARQAWAMRLKAKGEATANRLKGVAIGAEDDCDFIAGYLAHSTG